MLISDKNEENIMEKIGTNKSKGVISVIEKLTFKDFSTLICDWFGD